MQNWPIRITACNTPNIGDLTLSDNDLTQVDPGDTVTWIIMPQLDIVAITGLPPKTSSTNVFDECDPVSVGNSNNWKGTIKSGTNGVDEDYNILWTDKNGSNHTYDPRIRVNP